MDRFPLPADTSYRYAQRFTMDHLGCDIMAPEGTPVVAVEDGIAYASTEPKGGNVVYLEGKKSGRRYFYGHLDRWGAKVLVDANPRVEVESGDVLGYVGTTGNAKGRPPHLHFQQRKGSLVIDPFDDLQRVDPHAERGTRAGGSDVATFALILAVLWFASRS